MSVFRKRSKAFRLSSGCPVRIRDLRNVVSVVDGAELSQEVVTDMTIDDYIKVNPIVTEDFSLEEQIRAGVQLKDIPCSTMLDSSDNLDYEVNDSAEQFVLDKINEDINNNNSKNYD